jgi:hypothetical protein
MADDFIKIQIDNDRISIIASVHPETEVLKSLQ